MNLKTFSQTARRILIQGVAQKLLFWGFDKKDSVIEEPLEVEGGYILRGEAYDDPTVPKKWNSLKEAISKKGVETVVEEAAYTWFNRIMAIRILAKNGYDRPQLEYEGDSGTPTILVRARRGQADFLTNSEKNRLQKTLTDYSKDTESFALLLSGYCEHHHLLKSVFGRLDDYTELLLPENILEEDGLVHLLNTTDAISDEDYQKVELIGWLYQFYISERKDEVFAGFKKNKKAEAKDIPAATQIFTPNWIVKYMVQNTVGKLWLDLNPDSKVRDEMKYLIEDPDQKQAPIISEASQLKLLDPAVGSGHILVEGFDLLYAMYMEEYYTPEDAVMHILKDNLFGLDIDTRAVQLARFALLLKAAKYYPEVLSKDWMPQIFAMPDPKYFNRQEILDFLGSEGLEYEGPLENDLRLMRDAQNLGSAMFFGTTQDQRAFYHNRLLELKKKEFKDISLEILLQKIEPYIQILSVLSNEFEAVAANPPYMGSGNMNATLKEYLAENYPESKSDLFAVFMEVCNYRNVENGLMGMINQHSWMFLSSYEKLRDTTLANFGILNMLHLGPRTFEELSGEVVQSTAFVIQNGKSIKKGNYIRLVEFKSNTEKENAFLKGKHQYPHIPQSNFSKIPGSPIAYWVSERVMSVYENCIFINSLLQVSVGLQTGNNGKYIRGWFEVIKNQIDFNRTISDQNFEKNWYPCNKGGNDRKWNGNKESVIYWKNNGAEIKSESGSVIRNPNTYFKAVSAWTKISSGGISLRYYEGGFVHNDASCLIYSDDEPLLKYSTGLLNSQIKKIFLEQLSPTLNFTPGQVSNFPFIRESGFEIVISKVDNSIQISKSDWDSKEISWDFEQFPLLNGSSALKTAYRVWLDKVTEDFFTLHRNEEELNRIFIEIYGLEDELTPEVPLKEITILQEELDGKKLEKLEKEIGDKRLEVGFDTTKEIKLPIKREVVMKQLISYAIGISMGRYRLDMPGLHIAHPDPIAEELAPYSYQGHTIEIDEDAIIPIIGSAAIFSDDALQRVKYFLEVVWGADSLTQNLNFLQECLDEDLESYLVKKFWADHCKTYKKKPIYWLFSSDKGAFQVLVYMHRMNAFTVEKIRSNYLMPHLKHLRNQIDRLESSKDDPRLLDKLQKNLEECEAYDLILKDVADKQITFDLDDGVKNNYELFEGVVRKVK